MVRVNQLLDPLLRRPFGIHGLYREKDSTGQKNCPSCIEILYRIAGKGTSVLSEGKRGEEIDLLGPLGNGFRLEQNLETAMLVAGGIGIASLSGFPGEQDGLWCWGLSGMFGYNST